MTLRNMVTGVLSVCLLLVASAPSALASDAVVQMGGYSFVLPANWIIANNGRANPGVIAHRYSAGKKIGEILAATLRGDMDKEIQEMLNSANSSKGSIHVLDYSHFQTASFLQGRRLTLQINASDSDYGAPLIFHAIYLPRRDGGTTTFKLRCGESRENILIPEFNAILRQAKVL
ncbi:hypothetical protein DSLASN_28470 [Desulfoluna limicola]|uniref:Uncharacterized protein n=1 Tax=Desulfoluna limicola TaxID=2810562 RepID=A0ABN6F6C4_9BACT|nr:hypothetical protein [Desulfoluna limicola]BCS97215.1 hypothetical protein DSLASN_28470 [Desulfoluna limicola]